MITREQMIARGVNLDYAPRGGRFPMIPIDHEQLARLWFDGVKLHDMSAQLGATVKTISQRARRIGLPRRLKSAAEISQATACALYADGLSLDEVGAKVGCSGSMVASILRMRGQKVRPAVRRHPGMERECVTLYRRGLTYRQIAQSLGLRYWQVSARVRKVMGPGERGFRPRHPIERLVALRDRGLCFSEIARRCEVHRETVRQRLKRYDRRRGGALPQHENA
jgi:DNA-binding CsgD family transcriptional regulator